MSSTTESENRFAPPTAHVEDVPSTGIEFAGRGARLGAAIIDGLVQAVIYYALAFTVLSGLIPARSFVAMSMGHSVMQLIGSFGVFALVQGYLLATEGQTIGKKLLGLRIVRTDGSRASIGRLLGLRYFTTWFFLAIPVIGMFYSLVDDLLIFRQSHQCLHDNIADTIVVKA
jgi:uncharacterized RDD family membrane protein YckC